MNDLTITILPKDFDNVNYVDTNDCPLARAIKRTLDISDDDKNRVSVSLYFVTITKNSISTFYRNEVFGFNEFLELQEAFINKSKTSLTVTLKPDYDI